MHVLQYTGTSAAETADWDDRFQDYVNWVVTVQAAKDPNNINVLGEPKVYTTHVQRITYVPLFSSTATAASSRRAGAGLKTTDQPRVPSR